MVIIILSEERAEIHSYKIKSSQLTAEWELFPRERVRS